MSRSNLRPVDAVVKGPAAEPAQGSAPACDGTIRDNVACTYRKLERESSAAADLLAVMFTRLHEHTTGRCSSICGPHSPDVMRRLVRAEDSMNIGELVRLAVVMGLRKEVADFLAPLLDEIGLDVAVRPSLGPNLIEAVAEFTGAAGDLSAGVIRALGDGVLDHDEENAIEDTFDRAEQKIAAARAALARTRKQGGRL